jgi:hypothetical protein
MTAETREHAIAIAAAIFAARDLAQLKELHLNSPKAVGIISDAVSKAVSKAVSLLDHIDDTIRRRTPAP